MINWDQVKQLRSEVGEEDFDEVVDLFLEEVQEVVNDLQTPSPDRTELESKMHFLKGSALNLGFEKFSSICATGEKAAAAGQADTIDIQGVLDCYTASRDAFLKDLNTLCG